MTIFNLLPLVLVLVLDFSTGSMADLGCASSNAYMLWGECPPLSHEGLASWSKPRVTPPPRAPKYFPRHSHDELLLVLQWPASFCNTQVNNCDRSYRHGFPAYFTVHGLWLNQKSGSVCCVPSNKRITLPVQIKPGLWQDMRRYWPDLKCRRDATGFWISEYRKHGDCFPEFRNPLTYFLTAQKIRGSIGDMTKMQLSSGKTLIVGNYYQAKDFESVTILDGVRLIPQLRCSVDRSGDYQLQEIVFCTDIKGRLQDCSKTGVCFLPNWYIHKNGWFKFPRVPASFFSSSRSPP